MTSDIGRPTVHDIAREAGVSLATVDRVLNARSGVRGKTIAKVQAAVAKLGYVRDTHAANLARQRQYRFIFILPDGASQFVETLKASIKEAYTAQLSERISLKILTLPVGDPHLIVRRLQSLDTTKIEGIALMAPETPQLRDAVDRLKENGVAVVTLASDIPSSRRDYFVGINNIAAGRTAAQLMGRFVGGWGRTLVITNSLRSRDSLERRLGFDEIIYDEYPNIVVLPTIETYDDPKRTHEIVADMIQWRAPIAGVYSIGSGNKYILEALRQSKRAEKIAVIMHEVTPVTRSALIDKRIAAVINQNSGHLVRSAIRALKHVCDDLPIFDEREKIRIEVVLKENLP